MSECYGKKTYPGPEMRVLGSVIESDPHRELNKIRRDVLTIIHNDRPRTDRVLALGIEICNLINYLKNLPTEKQ